jgi:hypothetical protein
MVGPLGVVSGPMPMGGPIIQNSVPPPPSVVQNAPASPPPPPPPVQVTPAAPLPPPPQTGAPPITVPADQSKVSSVQPPAPTALAAPTDQATQTAIDNLDGLGGNADFNVTPIDNTIQPDPAANSGDQPQT